MAAATGTRKKKTPRPGQWKLWLLYTAGFVPAVWTFYLGATGQLGADPVKTFEHLLGLWALRFLILTLLVTPIRDLTGITLLRYRRALGLLAFYYALMHFTTYMVLDQGLEPVCHHHRYRPASIHHHRHDKPRAACAARADLQQLVHP